MSLPPRGGRGPLASPDLPPPRPLASRQGRLSPPPVAPSRRRLRAPSGAGRSRQPVASSTASPPSLAGVQ
jgi:hypothetical protein